MAWVRSQAQKPPAHTVTTSLQVETALASLQHGGEPEQGPNIHKILTGHG